MNRRSFLKRTAAFMAVAVGVPATMIPKALEAAPVVPHLTIPYHTIYAPSCSAGMSSMFGRSMSDIYVEQASKEFAAHIDNQILQDILNTKRKG